MSATSRERIAYIQTYAAAVAAADAVGSALDEWAGRGPAAQWSQAERDDRGRWALTELDAALSGLQHARDTLADLLAQ